MTIIIMSERTHTLISQSLPWGFPGGSDGKESVTQEDPGLIPGSGSSPGEGNGNPLQYSSLENSMNLVEMGVATL